VKADGDGARADMLSDGNILYVYGNSGKLIAYQITAKD
jgi:outer membrane protein assembly factor BamB